MTSVDRRSRNRQARVGEVLRDVDLWPRSSGRFVKRSVEEFCASESEYMDWVALQWMTGRMSLREAIECAGREVAA